ncbi:transposase [Chitinophaga alhagiae]|uniref:transposase n=1 Tax=Chitinophaga alhagiae TaxID=2203219 RepID=UPI000E5B9844|nr:transposase [Chitinophaga alhagiae]
MKKPQGRKSQYSDSERIAIAQDYLSSALSQSEIAAKYGITGNAVVESIVRWYKKHHGTVGLSSPPLPSEAPPPLLSAAELSQLRQKDKELEDARLKIQALELLIANAGKELGVDLVKKLGTKPSDK